MNNRVMELLELLRNDSIVVMVALIFMIIGLWLHKFFIVLMIKVFAPVFNFRVNSYQIFGRKYTRDSEDKFVATKTRFSIFPDCVPGPKPGETIDKKKDIGFSLLTFLVPSFCGIALLVVCLMSISSLLKLPVVLLGVILGLVIGLALGSVMAAFICIVSMFFLGSKSLHNFTNQKCRELNNANDANDVDMPPLESLNDMKGFEINKLSYQNVRFIWAEIRRDGQAMSEIARWLLIYDNMHDNISSVGKSISAYEFMMYRNLVLYYSIWNIDREKAQRYYKPVKDQLDKDTDINGVRLRAYYLMNVQGDFATALQIAKEALTKPRDNRFSNVEYNNEVKLLQELIDFIQKAQ